MNVIHHDIITLGIVFKVVVVRFGEFGHISILGAPILETDEQLDDLGHLTRFKKFRIGLRSCIRRDHCCCLPVGEGSSKFNERL